MVDATDPACVRPRPTPRPGRRGHACQATWRATLASACGALALLAATPQALAENSALRRSGDILRGLLPLAAVAVTVQKDDHEGLAQLGLTLVSSELTTEGLKHALNHTSWGPRPDGGPHSFPSGHATTACSSASFLGERYGWRYGAPALLPAAVVMYSRVDARAHHWRDVIAGCGIGAGFAGAMTTRRESGMQLQVQPLHKGVALSVSLPL